MNYNQVKIVQIFDTHCSCSYIRITLIRARIVETLVMRCLGECIVVVWAKKLKKSRDEKVSSKKLSSVSFSFRPKGAFIPRLCRPRVNFINVLREAFTLADPKSTKKLLNLMVFFALLGSARVKAACRMLVKLTPVVRWADIFCLGGENPFTWMMLSKQELRQKSGRS